MSIDSENSSTPARAASPAKPKRERKPKKPAKKAGAKKTVSKTRADRTNKKAEVIEMMKRANGATLSEIMAATKWQAHTVRGGEMASTICLLIRLMRRQSIGAKANWRVGSLF